MVGKANYVTLPKSERKIVAGARRIGDSQPDQRIEISVHVRRTPGSPGAAKLGPDNLSHEDLVKHYGGDPSDLAKVAAFAKKQGLAVIESSAAKRLVRLAGTVTYHSASAAKPLNQAT